MSDKPVTVLDPASLDLSRNFQRWGRLYGSSAALALAEAAKQLKAPRLVVAGDTREAERLAAELRFYLEDNALQVLSFPDWETLPYDLFSPHQDIVSERLSTLSRLPELRRGIVVLSAATMLQRLPPPSYVLGGTLLLKRGEKLDPESLRRRLEIGRAHV